jgi:biopolymer transport protein ExbD
MRLQRHFKFQPGFLYLAPVLDIAFLVTLFVVLSTSFLLQPGIAVQSPVSPFFLAPQRNPAVVSITGAPRPAIFYENQEVTNDGLRARLSGEDAPGTIVIKADRHAPYDLIMSVTTLAIGLDLPVVWATDPQTE